MHSYMKTFILLLGVAYFAGAQAETTAIVSVVVSPTATSSAAHMTQSHNATAAAAAATAAATAAVATPAVATPAASSAAQAGGQTTAVVSGGGAQSAVDSQATPAATSAGAGAGANPSPSSAAANVVVPATTAVANPAASSAGAGNQAPASPSVKVTEAPPKPTTVAMEMKITKTWNADYKNQSSSLFKNLSRDLYAALNSTLFSHGLHNVTIVSVKAGSIIVDMKLYFLVPSGSSTNIEEVIKNDKDGKLKSFGVDLESLTITFPGVTLGPWKPKSNECATKCCDGAGGSLNLERTCTPSASCGGISLTKKSENSCTSYCDKSDCNSGTLVKASISSFILAALALIRTLA